MGPIPLTALPSLPGEVALIARRLGEALHADAIWLYGSYARGDAGPDSDLDFLVVVPESGQSRYDRALEARRLVGDIPVPKDILVLTRREWEAGQQVVSSLASTVRREGVLLRG